MFFLTKFVCLLPFQFLVYLGAPFKFDLESSYRHYSSKDLKGQFEEKKWSHYGDRFGYAALLVFVSFMICLFTLMTGGYFLLVLPVVVLGVFVVDLMLILARYCYQQNLETEAKESNALVPVDAWKDTSLKSVLKKMETDKKDFEENKSSRIRGF